MCQAQWLNLAHMLKIERGTKKKHGLNQIQQMPCEDQRIKTHKQPEHNVVSMRGKSTLHRAHLTIGFEKA